MKYGIFSYSGYKKGLILTVQYAVEIKREENNINVKTLLLEYESSRFYASGIGQQKANKLDF